MEAQTEIDYSLNEVLTNEDEIDYWNHQLSVDSDKEVEEEYSLSNKEETDIENVVAQLPQRASTVHDMENLTFSANDRAENPHISARTISVRFERVETSTTAEKEMRNAIDEVCRKTKITQSENVLPA